MKTLHTLFIALGGLLLCASCDNYLDIKPKGVTLPEKFEDYERLLNHSSTMRIDNTYTIYITDDIELGEDTMQFCDYARKLDYQKNLYSFEHGAIFSEGDGDALYENAYDRIYTINVVVNSVNDCPDGSDEQKRQLIAKARFNRAYEYLMLVNAYAPAYDPTTAESDWGVPLLLSYAINQEYHRNTVAEVYQQIISDLEYAEVNLPDEVTSYYFPNKRCAYALAARTYLYMGNYEKARDYAEKVMLSEDPLIDLTEYIINPDANRWGMGRIYNAVTETTYPTVEEGNTEILLARDAGLVNLSRTIFVNKDLVEVYSHDLPEGAVDQRRDLFTADNFFRYMNNRQTFWFEGRTVWIEYCDINGGLNYQEMMLTLAECYVRLNMAGAQSDGLEKAYALLDRLRDKRIKNNQPLPHKDAHSALITVLEERRRELAFRGSHRFFDLKRLSKESEFVKEIVHKIGEEQTFTMSSDDPRMVLPLPLRVIAANPSLPVYER